MCLSVPYFLAHLGLLQPLHPHHRRGLVGRLRIRLVEASNLQRSHWSALALGPVKHFNLSKAHGAVSAYCTFSLQFANVHADRLARNNATNNNNNQHRKPAAQPPKQRSVVSPMIERNNNPVWDHCQFEFPIVKGATTSCFGNSMSSCRMRSSRYCENMDPNGIMAD